MNNYERILYRRYIDNLYSEKGLEGLQEFADYLLVRQQEIKQEREAFVASEYNKYVGAIAILRQNLYDFVFREIPMEERHGLSFKGLAISAGIDAKKPYKQVQICDVIGYSIGELLDMKHVGPKLVDVLDRYLKKYGLALDIDPEVAQLLALEVKRVEIAEEEDAVLKDLEVSAPELAEQYRQSLIRKRQKNSEEI